MNLKLSEIRVGSILPELVKNIVQEDINLYAEASLDHNPIHIDEEFAKKTPSGGTIAHGMLILAYVSQMMTNAFGISWINSGRLNIRFKAPACPGDCIKVQGKVTKLSNVEGQLRISCNILCSNQKEEVVITGEAETRIECDY
jgi:3-hydroxybutyryl-CoA dehydratase